ncbi:alpha-N-acetylglucosaminidase-like isoform X2 [Humulus lupulus]|uniref:alpha-N-acetylglucosaminidase-like isoform X2 n=1 Tax=Humulus lupulus TaxID=3486 RepID=UPI002B4040AF|nr:alpha-N-acetylglucosaminidase-like isoform X2 [Humulus lupulus]
MLLNDPSQPPLSSAKSKIPLFVFVRHHVRFFCTPRYYFYHYYYYHFSASPPMASSFPAIFFPLFFLICLTFPTAHPSTIGVHLLSNLLETQDRERAPPSLQLAAARGVLRRLIPSHSSSFDFQIVSKEQCGGASCFIIRNHPIFHRRGDPEILIIGVTGVDIVAGLHWYLKNWCGSHISWDKTGGAQLFSVPKAGLLPRLNDNGVFVPRPVPWSYYQNAVSSSYSFAWWDWKRWEKEIDWMALQGINLPLAFTGQEAIWQKVFQKFNIGSTDFDDFFGGPAFLAWSRMGNLHGWGGPLPQSWLDQQLLLQKKILRRMYELGMTPVLPAFSGNVPAALKSRFPSAKITRLGNWFTVKSDPRWCCTYLLDATDPLFVEIGRAFIEQQLEEYGKVGHIYNCDTFDENTPPVDDPEYISSLGAAIFRGMQSGDNNAIWLMQGWLFSYDPFWRPPQMKALLHSVPVGKLVVLDLYAEVKPIWISSEQFYGVPYIWCMLHNFAGNIEMYGILDAIASGPIDARTSENSTMVGVGMSMEGIEQNPIVYDLMSEMAFQHKKVDVKAWIDLYPARRYGRSVASVKDAWNILYHTIYNCTDGANDKNKDVIVAFPDVDPSLVSIPQEKYSHNKNQVSRGSMLNAITESFDQPHLWYSTSEVIRALELFLKSGDELSGSNTYRYDLVDLTRQALAKYANQLFLKVIEAYQSNDVEGVTHYSREFLDLVEDFDTLLACHEGFLLGPWLESAKQLAQDENQEKQFEWNARTQITMWFDNSDEEPSLLRDYGNKYWSGLLRDYYGPRAGIYFKLLIKSLEEGTGFPFKDWRREWIKLTNDWQSSRNVFPVKGAGDVVNTSRWLFNKYLQSPDNLQSLNEAAGKYAI